MYGNEFGRGLIPVECESGPIRVSGYLARPECCRPSRSMEHFFINRRYVKSVTMMAAVEESYRNHIMVGKFPGCIIELTIDPAQVDVNVHPAKLEVKLSDERSVFDAVVNACRGALSRMNRTVAVRDVGGKRFSEFELYHRPAEGTQTRMTAEQYRQMAESLPEKKTFGGVSMLSSGGSSRYAGSLPPKGTSYGMGEQPPAEPRKWEPKQETPIKTENETAEKAIDDIAEAPPAAAEKPELAPQEPEREAAAAEPAVPNEHEPEPIEEAPTVAGEEETTEP